MQTTYIRGRSDLQDARMDARMDGSRDLEGVVRTLDRIVKRLDGDGFSSYLESVRDDLAGTAKRMREHAENGW